MGELVDTMKDLTLTRAAKPLDIVIVGAGIAGLYAALALRKSGHDVRIYESSRFALETGAAIHLPSNVNGLLRRFGMRPEEHGGVTCEWVSEYRPNGDRVFLRDVSGLKHLFPYPWQLCHRIDLHNALKNLATEAGVKINLQSRIVSVDIQQTQLTLIDGTMVTGDLILGADGTHSVLRKYIASGDTVSKPSGTSAFRFLIPMEDVRADPETAHFAERNGELRLLYGESRRIVIYPCRDNKELNFVCLHPDECSESNNDDWNELASKELVLKVFENYPEDVKRLLGKARPETIKLWKLLDAPTFDTWIRGNFALLGDAAHPFLPHQGQGGAQAIEDAAALGALFPIGTTVEDIPSRLRLYMNARYERATTIQQYTRDSAFKTERSNHGGKVMDPMQFTSYNFDHDAWDHASGILRQHLARAAKFARMPLSFGPCPGPRQDKYGRPWKGVDEDVQYQTSWITFKTHKSYLATLIPSSEFKINSPGGWATATFSVTKLDNLKWLGGKGYSHLGLYIHNVEHNGDLLTTPNGDEGVEEKLGNYVPILFEDRVDPIITGREELGIPKVFAALNTVEGANDYLLSASSEGIEFCRITLSDLVAAHAQDSITDRPIFSTKMIPTLAEAGMTQVEYSTMSQMVLGEKSRERWWKAGRAEVQFTDLQGEQLERAFPTLVNVIEGLRAIRVEQIVDCGRRMYP